MQFPPVTEIERIAKYKRMQKIYDGKLAEVYERATELLKDTPYAPQLHKLYIAVNIVSTIAKKPADFLFGERPAFDCDMASDSIQQKRITSIVEENDIPVLGHESVLGCGIRGDAWLKVRYGYREDLSELRALIGDNLPDHFEMEPIIEHVRADAVFPEVSLKNVKKFAAINVTTLEWVGKDGTVIDDGSGNIIGGVEKNPQSDGLIRTVLGMSEDTPYLNVERHIPGFIIYERYRLSPKGVDDRFGVPIDLYDIVEKVQTGRDVDIVETGAPLPLVRHIPYTSLDDRWYGEGSIEKIETLLAAINDRLVQIDYILWKHSDPQMYGPPLDGQSGNAVAMGGKYIEVAKDEQTPGYLTWNSQLEGAFKELDRLLGLVYQITETPDWLFGTSVVGDGNKAGGTSHTSNSAIRQRFLPITSKTKRIRAHVDKALRDAIWLAQILENRANREVDDFEPYEPVYPVIHWAEPIPLDEKEQAETYNLRTGGKPTLDVKSAIKRSDNVDDTQADQIIARIEDDEKRANQMPSFVDASIFREVEEPVTDVESDK